MGDASRTGNSAAGASVGAVRSGTPPNIARFSDTGHHVVEEAALDKYSFTRDAFLQRRRNLVFDGNPPDEEELAPDPSAPDKP